MTTDDTELSIVELEENLEDVEKPKELPNGVYKAEIQDVQQATSQKGNDYYSIRFVIPPTEIPADFQDEYPDGAQLTYNRVLVPIANNRRSLFNFKQFLKSIGLTSTGSTFDPNEWMGREARVVVRQSKYQGEMRAGIAAIEQPASGGDSSAKAAPAKRGRR